MKKFLALPAALLALSAGPVLAADMPMKAAPAPIIVDSSWTGMYLGGSVGEQWSKNTYDPTCVNSGGGVGGGCGGAVSLLAFPGAPDSNAVFNNNGVRYGVYYGAMFQAAQHWVFGVESDYNFFNKTNTVGGIVGCATGTCPGFPPGFADASGDSTSIKTGNDFSLRARVGFLVLPDLMLYGTGGAAWQKITASATCSPGGTTGLGASPFCAILSPGPAYSESHTATLAGFTVGGGLEWKIAQHFLVRGEYRYSDYGTYHASFFQTVPASPNVFANVRVTSQVATFGIAYLIPPPKW